ncbi:hypothetical protein DSL72_002519 [Monilinia vaccinii-corymbosi]|uniref:Uncharacterized protein n=1 Tax=Monilinia vaccinii-corymbosi TaxID=61207 RepID=A0A8A3PCW7_9HELO|nr:hypothetical protein DSL72_002519 [Monilinia vaccinii-corymbosi]
MCGELLLGVRLRSRACNICGLRSAECIDGGEFCNFFTRVLQNPRFNVYRVTVFTDGGKKLDFDEVVMTTTLGWLERNKQAFQPPLPERFSCAVDSFPRLWLSRKGAQNPLSHTEISQTHRNPRSTSPSRGPSGPSPSSHLNPNTSMASPNGSPQPTPRTATPQNGTKKSCPSPPSPRATHTPMARNPASSPPRSPRPPKKSSYLAFFKPYYSLLPPFREARCAVGTTWLRDEMAGNGGYTCLEIGLEAGNEHVRVLREGCLS